MKKPQSKILRITFAAVFMGLVLTMYAFAASEGEEYVSNMFGTFWALVPPIIAIGLALITKEVYSSLFVGIVSGALFYSNFNLEMTFNTIFFAPGGMVDKVSANVGILIFLVVLGIMVCLMTKAGGTAAFGRWASLHIKTRVGAQLATLVLGVLLFIDDYFNCLTVGSVMRPVTDGHKVSRAKLSYLIDSTAAPICIIAPISSWAAAVTSSVPEDAGINGFTMFLQTIPYNFYALLTIGMVIFLAVKKFDYGPMKTHEMNAINNNDLFTIKNHPYDENDDSDKGNPKGRVFDLVIPIVMLVLLTVVGMIYTGGFFDGVDFITAFGNASASTALVFGSVLGLIFTFFYYIIRRVVSFHEFAESIPAGFKAMVPAILILTFAWTLSGMTNLLGGAGYVEMLVEGSAASLQAFLPAIVFVIAALLAFATGTSWGTFAILIPIVVGVFPAGEMLIISISACLAGAVCGDHCSPISDTTIMASAGAKCDHVTHVSTQLPYALTVAAVSFVSYIIAGFVQNVWIALPIAIVLMAVVLYVLSITLGKDQGAAQAKAKK